MTKRVESVLVRAWMRRGILAALLWPVSLLFRLLVVVRRILYRNGVLGSARLPVPVVVVGNIFIGGTGKTPLVIWLVGAMREAGFHPGVVSRGYGAAHDAPRAVAPDASPHEVGDEPALIAYRTQCPVVVGRDRVAAARVLLDAHPEVNLIIADDGLQHYALQRDVDIVLCDERGNGNGWLLPAGPLREPGSRSRDFTVVNASRLPEGVPSTAWFMRLQGETAERLCDRAQSMPLRELCGQRMLAAAGIGNPARFFAMLRNAGLDVEELPLPDHYDFADNPFAQVQADVILITEKDAVKCTRIDKLKNDPRLWVVPVTARLDGALAERIVEKCRGRPTA